MRRVLTVILILSPAYAWAQECPTYAGTTYCGNSLGVTPETEQNAGAYGGSGGAGDPLNEPRPSDAAEPRKFMRYGQTCVQVGNTVSCD